MIRLLIAGGGMIGRRHIAHAAAHPEVELVGVIDPDPAIRQAAPCAGFAELGEVDVAADGIVLATPTRTHAPLTEAALARGWHVLVEKPLAESLEAADRIVAAARAGGRHVLVGHHRRHHPKVARLREFLAEGRIGAPVCATMIWAMKKPEGYFDVAWRQGPEGGPVLQNMIHEVDLLRHLFGEVVHVAAFGANPVRGAQRVESGGAVLGFASGLTATVAFADTTPSPWGFEAGTAESETIAATGQDYLRIAGTAGAVEFPSLRHWSGARDWTEAPWAHVVEAPDGVPLANQLGHFAAVIEGRAKPIITAEDGRRTLAATLEIEAAAMRAIAGEGGGDAAG